MVVLFCCVVVVGISVSAIVFEPNQPPTTQSATAVALPLINQAPSTQATVAPSEFSNTQKPFTTELQAILKKRSGTYGVIVGDAAGTVYADVNGTRAFPSASIYKLYVAYAGYQLLDTGKVKADEPYQAGRTRLACLDAMIRSSDSPCAEKMAAELGKAALDVKLKSYGLSNTSVRSLTTTARDAARMLALIQQGTDLSEDSKNRLLNSMQYQMYRNGIPKGFADATVYNKVGFRDTLEYNDAALVKLPDGRIVTVVILTQNVKVSAIARLAGDINKLLSVAQ